MLLEHYLNGDDSAIALKHNDKSLTYLALKEAVTHLATWIINNNVSRIAIAFDNSFAWPRKTIVKGDSNATHIVVYDPSGEVSNCFFKCQVRQRFIIMLQRNS